MRPSPEWKHLPGREKSTLFHENHEKKKYIFHKTMKKCTFYGKIPWRPVELAPSTLKSTV